MVNAREFGKEVGWRTVWFLARTAVTQAYYRPFETLSAIYIVDRFGWPGARFVGRAGIAIIRSQLRLGIDLGRLAITELAPAFKPNNLLKPIRTVAPRSSAFVARVAPVAARVTPVAAAATAGYLLVQGPEIWFNQANDPNSNVYMQDEVTGDITPVHPLITGGFL